MASLTAEAVETFRDSTVLVPKPTGCPMSTNDEYVSQVLKLTNDQRAIAAKNDKQGASVKTLPLRLNDALTKAAQAHAEDLACNRWQESVKNPHQGSNGSNLKARTDAAGYPGAGNPGLVAENVARGYDDPERAINGWMTSTMGHKENMLMPCYTDIGIGYAQRLGQTRQESGYTHYWVQVFGTTNPASCFEEIEEGGAGPEDAIAPPFPSFASGVSGNPALVRVLAAPINSHEVVVPLAAGGLGHYWLIENTTQWNGPTIILKDEGQVGGVAMIQGIVDMGYHLEVVFRVGDRLAHVQGDPRSPGWAPPTNIGSGVSGIPGLVESTGGMGESFPGLNDSYGTLDVVVPLAAGGLAHFWRNNTTNSDIPYTWSKPTPFAQNEGQFDAVAILQTPRTGPRMFEVVARKGNRLAYFSRDNAGPDSPWKGPVYFATDTEVSGNPALLEAWTVEIDLIHLVVPLAKGGMAYFSRETTTSPWSGPTPFGQSVGQVDGVALALKPIHGYDFYTDAENAILQVVARIGDKLAYFERDSTGKWSGPIA
ncbi:MAG: CAP domain-containing protein [Chloroflexota bacterium]|nr:CAP domain-containing protein [Chloroflexota bacterium]